MDYGQKTERVTFRIPESLARRLKAAAAPGATEAEIARRAIDAYLDAYEFLGHRDRPGGMSAGTGAAAAPALSAISLRPPSPTRRRSPGRVRTSGQKR